MFTKSRVLLISLFAATVLVPVFGYATDDVPKFSDYPVAVFTGKHANISSKKNDSRTKEMMSVLAGQINFAGHYIIYYTPVREDVILTNMVDVKTGKYVGLPDIYNSASAITDDYREDSSLLIINVKCQVDDVNCKNVSVYFNYTNGKFERLKTIMNK